MKKWAYGLATLVLLVAGAGTALAEPTGQALGVDPQAEAERRGASQLLTVGADIFIGDRVVTGDEGQVQIRFSDNTRLVVGPRSALVIEDYLIRENGSAGKFAINALNGTFRFVSGNAPKDRYEINTPTGTIGVRGTAFELYVTATWVYVLMQNGATINCPNDGSECMILDDACEYGIMGASSTEVVGHADGVTGESRDEIKEFFQYAQNESPLDRLFRISGSERCLRRPAPEGGAPSSVETGTGSPPSEPDYPDKYPIEYGYLHSDSF